MTNAFTDTVYWRWCFYSPHFYSCTTLLITPLILPFPSKSSCWRPLCHLRVIVPHRGPSTRLEPSPAVSACPPSLSDPDRLGRGSSEPHRYCVHYVCSSMGRWSQGMELRLSHRGTQPSGVVGTLSLADISTSAWLCLWSSPLLSSSGRSTGVIEPSCPSKCLGTSEQLLSSAITRSSLS